MTKDPHVSQYLDEDEKELIEAIEVDSYEPGPSLLTPDVVQDLQEAARNTFGDISTKLSIRIAKTDLARVKAQALREGVLYQTLISPLSIKP